MPRIVQNWRTSTPNKPPVAGSLLPGQLGVEMNTPTRLWVGVPAGDDPALQKLLFDSSAAGGITEPIGAGTWGRLATGAWERSVAVAGDTMTGTLDTTGVIITNAPTNDWATLALRRDTGAAQILGGTSANLWRWSMQLGNGTPETGANAGSDFALVRCDDLGVAIDAPMTINRATGQVSFSQPLPYVLKAGDTMTGWLVAGAGVNFDTSGSYMAYGDATNKVFAFGSPDWQWVYQIATGMLTWFQFGGAYIQLAPGGSLNASGNVTAVSVVRGSAGVYANAAADLGFWDGGATRFFQFAPNWYWAWDGATGGLSWMGASAGRLSIDPGGSLWSAGSISATGNVSAGAAVFVSSASTADFYLTYGVANNTRLINFANGWQLLWWNANRFDFLVPGPNAVFVIDGGGNTSARGVMYAQNFVPSDERIKRNVQPYTRSLADIIQLEPSSFEYTGDGYTRDTGETRYGVVAQQAQAHVPECVVVMPSLPSMEGGDMRVPEQLAFDVTALVFAFFNCFKEIEQRLRALEPAREA